MKIDFPWPAKGLSPNERVSRWVLARARKRAKLDAAYITREAIGRSKPEAPVHMIITFHPKTKNLPDKDNAIASFKPYQDGMAAAFGIDDGKFDAQYFIGDPVKGGRVTVEITSAIGIPYRGTIS